MNKKETAAILKILMAEYPNTKVKDPGAMIDAWNLVLGEYPADLVGKAARLYMSQNRGFFPSAGEIKSRITRAELIYGTATTTIEAPKKSEKEKLKEDLYLEALCRFVGLGCEPDDNALDYFMPWEK